MLGKTLAVGTLALALAAAASAGGRVTTVSLKLTIAGAGTVKVADKAPITCTSTCHRTLHIERRAAA